jgi:hypothetical protein
MMDDGFTCRREDVRRLMQCSEKLEVSAPFWQLHVTYDADLLKIRAENATLNGILIGSVVMTEILVWGFDAAVPGPGTASNPGARSRNCIKPPN